MNFLKYSYSSVESPLPASVLDRAKVTKGLPDAVAIKERKVSEVTLRHSPPVADCWLSVPVLRPVFVPDMLHRRRPRPGSLLAEERQGDLPPGPVRHHQRAPVQQHHHQWRDGGELRQVQHLRAQPARLRNSRRDSQCVQERGEASGQRGGDGLMSDKTVLLWCCRFLRLMLPQNAAPSVYRQR